MKLLCHKCNTIMDYEDSKGGEVKGSLEITFLCPECENRISMITNPGETQLVSTFGVKLGGKEVDAEPLELTKSALLQDEPKVEQEGERKQVEAEIEWSEEARKRLERVPPFVKPMAKRAIERFAKDRGYNEITLSVMDEAKGVVGH